MTLFEWSAIVFAVAHLILVVDYFVRLARRTLNDSAGSAPTPVDADTVEPKDDEYDPPRHVSHFATCPNADHHRRKSK